MYRLYVEQVRVAATATTPGDDNEDAERLLRQALHAAGLDPGWVVVGPSSAGGGAAEDALGDAAAVSGWPLLEARRVKAAAVGKAAVQLTVCGFPPAPSSLSSSSSPSSSSSDLPMNGGKGKGERGKGKGKGKGGGPAAMGVGRLQSPAPGVLTAVADAEEGEAPPSPIGARLCVQVCERERLLSVSVVLPVAAGQGNANANATATAHGRSGNGGSNGGLPEVLEVPLTHLHALCAGKAGATSTTGSSTNAAAAPVSAVFGARSRPPRWSALHGLYALEFEDGARRVREPSRKNFALLDVGHLPPAALAAHHPHVGKSGGGGGGGGGGGVVGGLSRGLARGSSGAGTGAGSAAAFGLGAEEAGWSREKGPRPVLQLGKVGENRFSLDFRGPFSPFQALAVAIAAFEA